MRGEELHRVASQLVPDSKISEEEMRTYIAAIGLLVLAACSPTTGALVAGDPSGAVDLVKGAGSVSVNQSGRKTFRYVFPEKHLEGLVPPEEQEAARLDLIGNFIGERQICLSGWDINSRKIVLNNIIYEGSCRG